MKHIQKFESFSFYVNDDKLNESVKSNIAAALMLIGTLTTTQNTYGRGYSSTRHEIEDTKIMIINDIDRIDPTDPFLLDIKNKISSNGNEYVYNDIIQDLISYCDKNNMYELSNILKELNVINKSTEYGSDIHLDKINQKEKLYNILKNLQKIRELEQSKSNGTNFSLILLLITIIGLFIKGYV
jgi:hypothetical protein